MCLEQIQLDTRSRRAWIEHLREVSPYYPELHYSSRTVIDTPYIEYWMSSFVRYKHEGVWYKRLHCQMYTALPFGEDASIKIWRRLTSQMTLAIYMDHMSGIPLPEYYDTVDDCQDDEETRFKNAFSQYYPNYEPNSKRNSRPE